MALSQNKVATNNQEMTGGFSEKKEKKEMTGEKVEGFKRLASSQVIYSPVIFLHVSFSNVVKSNVL
jgi:hypothetical protein